MGTTSDDLLTVVNERWSVHHGDCLEWLRTLPDNYADAMVTDPPAGIGFMGKDWDRNRGGRAQWIAWLAEIMAEARRVLKPGAHAFVWALPRTAHWTATGVEDGGFEVREKHYHLFGSGFPKSLNVSKAIDAYMGTDRAGRNWEGYGTATKPAAEEWILARIPLDGTVAENVLRNGCGGVNVDGCRLHGNDNPIRFETPRGGIWSTDSTAVAEAGEDTRGRWPPNVYLTHSAACDDECASDCPIRAIDEQSGDRPGMSGGGKHRDGYASGMFGAIDAPHLARGDSGGASRFFHRFTYAAKPSRGEREAGCAHIEPVTSAEATGSKERQKRLDNPRTGAGRSAGEVCNNHPTVKGDDLMRVLCRLITPPDGLIIDPFTGSGSTGRAAMLEGFRFAGCELDERFVQIARARIAHVIGWESSPHEAPSAQEEKQRRLFG